MIKIIYWLITIIISMGIGLFIISLHQLNLYDIYKKIEKLENKNIKE